MRRLGLLLLVALTPIMPAAIAASARAGDGAGGPSQLWQTYPLGPLRHAVKHHSVARPHLHSAAVTPSPRKQPAGSSSGSSGSADPFGWLLAAGVVAVAGAGAVAAGRRVGGVPRAVGVLQGATGRRPDAQPADVPPSGGRTDLYSMSRPQLYQLAAERGVEGRSRMTRERLIEVLDDEPPGGAA
jgi:hypothetical protein